MRVLLITPPLIDLHSPYPATVYLSGFLNSREIEVGQKDASLDLALRIFSATGLQTIRDELSAKFGDPRGAPPSIAHFLRESSRYVDHVETAVRFLQGRDPTLATRICTRNLFPESHRLRDVWAYERVTSQTTAEDPLDAIFGRLGLLDRARYLASVFLEDIACVIREGLDDLFSLSRYGEQLSIDASGFDSLAHRLESSGTFVERIIDGLAKRYFEENGPDLVGLTVPFPGNLYGALRLARAFKKISDVPVAIGGGYVNTQLRKLSDPRVFDYADYITLDDGERPILSVIDHVRGRCPDSGLLRTFVRRQGRVRFESDPAIRDIAHADTGLPTYAGLDLGNYLSVSDVLCPIPRLTTLGLWNKLTLAHGCYWKRCAFCDTSLDYIGRYETAPAKVLLERIRNMIRETGSTGFHFVDEAAPPATLRSLCRLLVESKVGISWWSMVRFDKAFTPELAALLAQAGCVAVEGGLEVVSSRILKLMDKGTTPEQVARVTKDFSNAGILVHAFLMYGFPSQTLQETVDALEYVRQLFVAGCLHSAVWSRFSLTAHSPAAIDPKKFGIRVIHPEDAGFSHYTLGHEDPALDYDMNAVGEALGKALNSYIHQRGFEVEVQEWFRPMKAPRPSIADDAVERAL